MPGVLDGEAYDTSYGSGAGCVDGIVADYLVGLALPAPGTVC